MDDNNKPRKPRDGDDRPPRRDSDDRPPRRDNDRPSYSSDRPRRDGDSRPPRRDDDRGPRRDNDRPSYGRDNDRGSRSNYNSDDRPRSRYNDDDRGPRRDSNDRPSYGRDNDRGPRRDNDRPSYGRDNDRGSRSNYNSDDRPRSRYNDDDRGPRRDNDRPSYGRDNDRGPRRDNDRPSYASGDRDRAPRRDNEERRPRFEEEKPRRPEVRTQLPIIESDTEEVDTSVMVETERFVIWVSNEPDDERVYHVELDTVTLHFFAEDWEEFIALVQGAIAVDGGKPKAKKKAAAGKKPAKAEATPETVIGELTEGAVEVGGDDDVDHDPTPFDLTGDDEGSDEA